MSLLAALAVCLRSIATAAAVFGGLLLASPGMATELIGQASVIDGDTIEIHGHYSTAYVGQETAAQAAGAGLWRGTFTAPWDWRHAKRTGVAAGPQTTMPEPAAQTCCKVCTTGQACGNSCLSRSKTCHKPPGCACNAP